MRDFTFELRRPKASERRGGAVSAKQVQHPVGQVPPILRRLKQLCVNRLNLRRLLKRLDISIDEGSVVANGVGGLEDDVEMVETAEVLQEKLEVVDRRGSLWQQAEDVRVERDA